MASREQITAWLRANGAYAAVYAALSVLVFLPWWSSKLLPLMDYSQFLSFVRAFEDVGKPGSPFHGTYTTGFAVSPLVLPILIIDAIGRVSSIETGGRVLLTLYAIGLPAAAAFLLSSVGQSRWNVVGVFPLVFSKWVSSGFFGFFTGVPLVLLAYAFAVRHFTRPTLRRGIALAAILCSLLFWHALLEAEALLGVGILWLLWRAPSWRARWLSLLPFIVPFLLMAVWYAESFKGPRPPVAATQWPTLAQRLDAQLFFNRILMLFPDADAYAKALLIALAAGLVLGVRQRLYAEPDAPLAGWRARNPLAVFALVALGCFLAFPQAMLHVEIIHLRFVWFAALYLVLAWSWPSQALARGAAVGLVLAVGAAYLVDVNARFRAFDRETIGGSRLIDSIADGSTLIAPLSSGETKAFQNLPIREIQQYATVRKGGLPTTSFAGYGTNYIRYVHGNPMPDLDARSWLRSGGLTRFDYVLLLRPDRRAFASRRVREVRRDGEWVLFAVCGSRALPKCS